MTLLTMTDTQGKPEAVKLYLAYMYNAITAWGTAYKKTGATYSDRDWKYEAIIGQLTDLEYTGKLWTRANLNYED